MATKILGNKPLLILGAAEAISTVGNWITMMAVFSLLVFRGDGGATESSGVFLAGLLPLLVFSPLAGKLCDRYNQVKLILLANIMAGGVVSFLIKGEGMYLIFSCLAIESVLLSVMTPARQALLPRLVDAADLSKANAFLQQISSLVKVFGPAVGAAVVGAVGPHRAVILDVLSFGLAAALLAVLPRFAASALPGRLEGRNTLASEARDKGVGQRLWPFLRQSAPLKLLFVAGFLAVIIIMGLDVLSSVYTRDVLQAGERFFGLYLGAVGLGSVLAGMWLLTRRNVSHPFADLARGLACLAFLVVVLGSSEMLTPQMARIVALGAAVIGGWGNGLILIQSSTVLQMLSPRNVLGRIAGFFQSTIVAGQLISLAATPLIVPRYLSVGAFFFLSGLTLLLVVLLILIVSARSGSGLVESRFSFETQGNL